MNFCGPMRAKCYLLWQINDIMVLNCPVCLKWPCVASPRMVLFLSQSRCVALCGLAWPLYGLICFFLWQNIVFSYVIKFVLNVKNLPGRSWGKMLIFFFEWMKALGDKYRNWNEYFSVWNIKPLTARCTQLRMLDGKGFL